MSAAEPLAPAFLSQAVFRETMQAMARPGAIRSLGPRPLSAPTGLPCGLALLGLTLCDFDTPLWLDPTLRGDPITGWLRLHTGAPITDDPGQASFALVADAQQAPRLQDLAIGTPDYPDRSTLLVLAVDVLENDGVGTWRLTGPGIAGEARLIASTLPPDLRAQRADLTSAFPRGIDMLFVCGGRVAALPRTTIVESAET